MLSAKLKAEADNTYQDLDYLVYTTKTESNNSFIIHGFEENDDKHTIARRLNWCCYRKSCIAHAAHRLVSYLLADNKLICRLC